MWSNQTELEGKPFSFSNYPTQHSKFDRGDFLILLDNPRELLSGRKFVVVTIDIQNDYCSNKSPATHNTDHEFKREAARHLSKFLEASSTA